MIDGAIDKLRSTLFDGATNEMTSTKITDFENPNE